MKFAKESNLTFLYCVSIYLHGNEPNRKRRALGKAPVAKLVRNAAPGVYYGRVRSRGKLIWKSLKTDRISVAKLRLGDFLKEDTHRADATRATIH